MGKLLEPMVRLKGKARNFPKLFRLVQGQVGAAIGGARYGLWHDALTSLWMPLCPSKLKLGVKE